MAFGEHAALFCICRLPQAGGEAGPEGIIAMRVLVTGATGMIGTFLIHHLVARGHWVRALSRKAQDTFPPQKSVEVVSADVRDIKALQRAAKNADVVFHLAAKLHLNNPAPELKNDYEQVNVKGTENVAKAVYDNRVGRLVHFSTINVYGAGAGNSVFTEKSPFAPQTFYARTKVQAEQAVWDILAGNMRSSAVVLRLAAVYGPRIQGNYSLLVKALKHRCFWQIGSGQNRRTLIYIDDLASGAALAATHPAARGKVFNMTDGCIHTFAEIVRAISLALGRRPPRFQLPCQPALRMAPLGDRVAQLIGLRRLSPSLLFDKMLEDVAVSGDKIARDLGFRAAVGLCRGWQKAIGG
jgi:UDP-glucose 4-epimerase